MKNRFKLFAIASAILMTYSYSAFSQTYDLEVQFIRMKCLKVVEFVGDTQEDIYGRICLPAYKMKDANGTFQKYGCCFLGANQVNFTFDFFSVANNHAIKLGLNETRDFNTYKKIASMSYTQLLSLEFGLGGYLMDQEIIPVNYQNCKECGTTYRLIRLVDYKSQIDAMTTNGSKFLNTGNTQILELNFYEGDLNSSRIQCHFKLKLTKR